jgi:hypothetical protein
LNLFLERPKEDGFRLAILTYVYFRKGLGKADEIFFTLYYSDGIKDRFVLIIAEGFLFKLSSIIIVFSFSANYKKGKSFLFEPR